AVISSNQSIIDRSAVTTIITDTYVHLPAIFLPIPLPNIVLNPIARPNSSNSWNVTWAVDDETYITSYELQEATDINFTAPNVINVPVGTQNSVRTLPLQINNLF
ncbi:MAG: hypothetical protein GWO08_03165, partial [Gammaproteobacteria bacterium]|nr:hypothetical protein [Gammaproteobacteria bacterium]NIW43500.1 hypothetical protein [Gammaproteobacteria bacterium]